MDWLVSQANPGCGIISMAKVAEQHLDEGNFENTTAIHQRNSSFLEHSSDRFERFYSDFTR